MDYSLMIYSKTEFLSFFIIYSVLGWMTEVVYQTIKHKKFINRGFLNGPVCPIYGFGLLLVLIFLEPLKSNYLVLFIGSILFATILELVTGFVLEKIFQIRWWDYSKEKYNLNGYICLRFSIIWGCFGVLAVNFLHPSIYYMVNLLPHKLNIFIDLFIMVIYGLDFVLTVITVLNISRNMKVINEMSAALTVVSDDLGLKISNDTLRLEERAEQWKGDMELEKLAFEEIIEERREQREKRLEEAYLYFHNKRPKYYLNRRNSMIHKRDGDLINRIKYRINNNTEKN